MVFSKLLKNKELNIIEKIRREAERGARRRPRLGIGDDCAVLPGLAHGQELLITTDLLVEGSHFERERHPAAALGHKTLARGLSDIAAMGGVPSYALLSLCVPQWASRKWQKQFFSGLFRLAGRHGVTLVGGDLAAGERFVADIVVLGGARRGRTLERAKARVGDTVYVSGHLGGSALGLAQLRSGRSRAEGAVERHLYPVPRLALGQYLAGRLRVRAAIDLSDGLSIDLYRMTHESGVGAEIRAGDIPRFPGALLDQALHGGEDYELLFTLDPRRKPPAAYQGIPLTPIGVITGGRRLILKGEDGGRRPLPILGFQHYL